MKRKNNQKFINRIIFGDSMELLREIEDSSIDLVLTDPPYFLDKLDENWKHDVVSDKKNQYVVKSLPAGMKFDRGQGRRFYDWYFEISKQIYRILKPGGFFLSFSSPRLYHRMASAMDDTGFEIRDAFLWLYTQNQVKAMSLDHFIKKLDIGNDAKEKLKKELEGWKTPQIKSCYEPIAVGQKPPSGTFLQNILNNEVGLFNTKIKVGNNMFPSNVMTVEPIAETLDKYFLVPKPSKQEKGYYNTHMTVKPLSLCEHLIALSTYAKDAVVLDPFVGSGTTAIAAKNLGKRYIGIDSNKEYVDVAIQRLKKSHNLFQ
jgi:site-specific DNA-methyltransferase (adenine-specific)